MPDYELHIAALATDKGVFKGAVSAVFTSGSDDVFVNLCTTKATDPYNFDCVMGTLGVKKRAKKIDEGYKAGAKELQTEIEKGVQLRVSDGEKKSAEQEPEMRRKILTNHIIIEITNRTATIIKELKWSVFAAVMSPEVHYELAYADTEGAELMKIETRGNLGNYHVLTITIGTSPE